MSLMNMSRDEYLQVLHKAEMHVHRLYSTADTHWVPESSNVTLTFSMLTMAYKTVHFDIHVDMAKRFVIMRISNSIPERP